MGAAVLGTVGERMGGECRGTEGVGMTIKQQAEVEAKKQAQIAERRECQA